MIIFITSFIIGLILLVWSADKFVDGSSQVARYYGLSPLLIGMVIIGFGTSAPELVVSTISSYQGNPGIALGNAYGSNIANISLILGITALIMPISVNSQVLRKELPILTLVTLITIALTYDLNLSRIDAMILLIIFLGLMFWTVLASLKKEKDTFSIEVEEELNKQTKPLKSSLAFLVIGLIVLIGSSRLLVYGSVGIATALGVSDVIVGLTIVAVGTSLPELASSIIAARKNEPDMALGNILGSNLFNTLAVVGIAGSVNPLKIDQQIFSRDISAMTLLTISLFIICFGFKKKGRINRLEGGGLLIFYLGYTSYLIFETLK